MEMKTMTVRDVAMQAGVAPEVVRYYSRIGMIKSKRNQDNGYRLFDKKIVTEISFIRKAQNLGFTLKEIKQILSHSSSGTSPCPMVRNIIEEHIEENRIRLDELQSMQTRMEAALKQWKNLPDGTPNGDSVCVLIESFIQETGDK